jgi:hypothetical protein
MTGGKQTMGHGGADVGRPTDEYCSLTTWFNLHDAAAYGGRELESTGTTKHSPTCAGLLGDRRGDASCGAPRAAGVAQYVAPFSPSRGFGRDDPSWSSGNRRDRRTGRHRRAYRAGARLALVHDRWPPAHSHVGFRISASIWSSQTCIPISRFAPGGAPSVTACRDGIGGVRRGGAFPGALNASKHQGAKNQTSGPS